MEKILQGAKCFFWARKEGEVGRMTVEGWRTRLWMTEGALVEDCREIERDCEKLKGIGRGRFIFENKAPFPGLFHAFERI